MPSKYIVIWDLGCLKPFISVALAHELTMTGVAFHTDQAVPLHYKGLELHCGHRLDVVVEGRLVLELKSVDHLLPVHKAQLLTYLRLLRLQQGLLINFNVARLADGIKSVVLTTEPHEGVKT